MLSPLATFVLAAVNGLSAVVEAHHGRAWHAAGFSFVAGMLLVLGVAKLYGRAPKP